jgi:hypothetical protein
LSVITYIMDEVPKKKRGRKPKVQEVADKDKATDVVEEGLIVTPQDGVKKKRGRKPKCVYNAQEAVQVQQPSSLSDDENIIVKLNVTTQGDEESFGEEEEEEHPYAYNRDVYSNLSNIYDNAIVQEPVEEEDEKHSLKVVDILKDFEEKNKIKEWPTNTSICCYWCCNKFNNPPYGIPINYNGVQFDVFGCFCSLECAATYNFKMQNNIDEMWERNNLINLLYRKLGLGRLVHPAPDRLALKMFGGYMDIEEFRSFFKSNKVINVNFPPMISMTQQIEEINEHEINNDFKYVPLDQDRIDKYKAKTLFKRNKPLMAKSTLESSMNLKYV